MPIPPLAGRARKPHWIGLISLVGVSCLMLAPRAHAQPDAGPVSPANPSPSTGTREPNWTLASGARVTLFPTGEVFPVYVADPYRSMNVLRVGFYGASDISDTGSPRWALSAGGRFGMLRFDPATPRGRSWQISIDAGVDAVFDAFERNDAIGWDGNYGLTFTTASSGRLAMKVALLHISAHMGDEYQERTNRQRANYTREELAFGAAWRFSPRWRGYGEAGVGYVLRNDDQKPWRAQFGLEYETGPALAGGRFAPYAAANASSAQERGWRLDTAIEGGIVTRSNARTIRLFLALLDGRPTIGEFFEHDETVLTLGLRIDL